MRLLTNLTDEYSDAVLAIYNDAIANTTSIYEYHARDKTYMEHWFAEKRAHDWPVLGMVDDAGELLGFAVYGRFRPHAAYKYSVEHSVYVRSDCRGRGIGGALLTQLIKEAEQRGVHVMVAGVDAANEASKALHRACGFAEVGIVRQAGFKFGRWLDLAFFQRILPTPADPVDG
ncbi:MAG: GNAT family N-acetyltransferase [Methylobacteriaceae bacterium]|nr:GNAT family N-acetyltransferase [Methylobacteriaceae bacterium]